MTKLFLWYLIQWDFGQMSTDKYKMCVLRFVAVKNDKGCLRALVLNLANR